MRNLGHSAFVDSPFWGFEARDCLLYDQFGKLVKETSQISPPPIPGFWFSMPSMRRLSTGGAPCMAETT